MVDAAKDVRIRNVNVICVDSIVNELPFNSGYYTVDLTFFFDVCLELSGGSYSQFIPVNGIAAFNKKCVLYGSEGGVKTFYSDMSSCYNPDYGTQAQPRVSVQVAEPVALSVKLCDICHSHCDSSGDYIENMPQNLRARYGTLDWNAPVARGVFATIGMFTILQMSRNVQMLIPAYDFCIPTKECNCNTENPCDLFSTIEFPTDAFFPPKATDDITYNCGYRQNRSTDDNTNIFNNSNGCR